MYSYLSLFAIGKRSLEKHSRRMLKISNESPSVASGFLSPGLLLPHLLTLFVNAGILEQIFNR